MNDECLKALYVWWQDTNTLKYVITGGVSTDGYGSKQQPKAMAQAYDLSSIAQGDERKLGVGENIKTLLGNASIVADG